MYRARAFTIIEVLVVLAIAVLLTGLIFLVAAPSKESARQLSCMSNLKQIYHAIYMYTGDYGADSAYPELHGLAYFGVDGTGTHALNSYLKTRAVWFCPSAPGNWTKGMATTYIGDMCASPENEDGSVSGVRRRMIEKEKRLGDKLAIFHCTIHDELFYAPHERDTNMWAAKPYRIELRVNGSVWRGRGNGPREIVFSANR